MNAIAATTEDALESAQESPTASDDLASEPTAPTEVDEPREAVAADEEADADGAAEVDSDPPADDAAEAAPTAGADESNVERLDRKKLEEQLEALKRKELELRRALMMADHPALADAIRAVEGRAYAIGRAEAKLAQGLSKSEARRRETLNKKLGSLRDKRAELDEQITQLETELSGLGADRTQVFEAERREAVQALFVALGTHDAAFREVGIEPQSVVPEIVRFLPEIEALAEQFAADRPVDA